MSKKIRIIKAVDVLNIRDGAKNYLAALPTGARIEGCNTPLTHGDVLALSYLNAVLELLGEDTLHIQIKLKFPDSDVIE